jgi:histidinol-phosphate aminotransferase
VNAPVAKASVATLADYTPRELSDAGVPVRAHRNEAALPAPEHVIAALRSIDASLLSRYPDDLQTRAIGALAKRLGVEPACMVLGNGADDVLGAIANTFLAPGDRAVTVSPTFGTYARAIAVAGAKLQTLRYRDRWKLDVDALIALALGGAKVVILGHPNNPTGEPLENGAIARIAAALPTALIVVDEVYLTFSKRSLVSTACDFANVVVVGSLSKVAALAGLRVGYATAGPRVATTIRRAMPPFPVGAPALVATEAYASGGAATDFFEHSLASQIERSLELISAVIRPRARSVWRGPSNFLLADFGNDAMAIEARLLDRGVAVRSFSDPALTGCLRFCALDDRSTRALIEAFDA